jgi:hypothetical protein
MRLNDPGDARDTARLDWLLKHMQCDDVEVDGITRPVRTREEIDEAMKDEREERTSEPK